MYQRGPAVCEVLKYQEKMNHFNAGFKVVLHDGPELVPRNHLLPDLRHWAGRHDGGLSRQRQHAPGCLGVWKLYLSEKHHRGSLQSFECDHKINLYVLNMIIATVNKHNYFPRVEHRTLVCNPDHFTTQRDCRDPNPGPSTVMSYHSFLKWCNFVL